MGYILIYERFYRQQINNSDSDTNASDQYTGKVADA
jgi:hypothetical protein